MTSEYVLDTKWEVEQFKCHCNQFTHTTYIYDIKIDSSGNVNIQRSSTTYCSGSQGGQYYPNPVESCITINDNVPIPDYIIEMIKNCPKFYDIQQAQHMISVIKGVKDRLLKYVEGTHNELQEFKKSHHTKALIESATTPLHKNIDALKKEINALKTATGKHTSGIYFRDRRIAQLKQDIDNMKQCHHDLTLMYSNPPGYDELGASCDKCNRTNIIDDGRLFHCNKCDDYDICNECNSNNVEYLEKENETLRKRVIHLEALMKLRQRNVVRTNPLFTTARASYTPKFYESDSEEDVLANNVASYRSPTSTQSNAANSMVYSEEYGIYVPGDSP